MFSARLSGYFSDVSRDYSQISCYFPPDSKKVFLLSQALISIENDFKNHPLSCWMFLSFLLQFLSIAILVPIFCVSPTLFLLSVCLCVLPHFLSVSILILIFYLSPSLIIASVCLRLYPYFLLVSILY